MSAKVSVKCTYCDTEFLKYAKQVRPKNFCCNMHRDMYNAAQNRGNDHHQYTSVIVNCAACNAELVRPPARLEISKNHFCNHECYGKWRKGKLFFIPPDRVVVTCEGCGKDFDKPPHLAKNKKEHYCSWECYTQHVNNKAEYTCLYCNASFKRTASAKQGRKHAFCCPEHWYAWRSENEGGETHYLYKSTVVHCANCHASLTRPPSRTDNQSDHFCDSKCYGQWVTKNKTGENAFSWKGGNVTVPCAQCGAELERPMNAVKRSEKHFCDIHCRGDWQSENKTGESHPLWTGGYKNYYGPNWNKQRQAARERDNHTCQKCDKTREENGKELDVHHIIPFRKFKYKAGENDNYLQANQLDNLTTLCTNCHSKTKAVKPKS